MLDEFFHMETSQEALVSDRKQALELCTGLTTDDVIICVMVD